MTDDDKNKLADKMMELLDLAKAALEADDLERSFELLAQAHDIADQLPKTKQVLQ